MRTHRAALLAIALTAARPAAAGIELAGTTGANFLSVGPAASLVGMGGTGIGGYRDIGAITWNPASLGLLRESQLMLTHMPMPNATSQQWMAFGGRMGASPMRWALSGRYQGDGALQTHDALGNPIGPFNASSLALGIHAARPLDQHFVVGMGAEFVNENLGDISGRGGTFDFGGLYHSGPLSLGVAAQNTGGAIHYGSLDYSMPRNLGAGLTVSSAKTGLTASLDLNHPNAYYDDLRAGAEWMWKDRLALRAGYRHEIDAPINDPMNATTAGLGVGGHGMWLDYSYVSSGDGSSQQRITVRLSPKDWGLGFSDNVDAPQGGSPSSTSPPASAAAPAPAKPADTGSPAASSTASSGAAPGAASSAPASSAPSIHPAGSAAAAGSATSPTPASSPGSKAGRKPAATSASAAVPTPQMTTLVPITPPAAPAPKPVAQSHAMSLPGVTAPAPQSPPSAAPAGLPDVVAGAGASAKARPASGAGAAAATPAATAATAATAAPAAAPASMPAVAGTPAVVESAVRPDGKAVKIHVKKDETLDSIAKRFGTSKAAVMMENNLASEKLHAGQELTIPNHQ